MPADAILPIFGGQAPGAFHHIICRGMERRKIFYEDTDRDTLLTSGE
jgi:hypothetical protein